MLHLSTWEAILYQIFLKKINQARLNKLLFPVQRVAAIVASWAATLIFFFLPFLLVW